MKKHLRRAMITFITAAASAVLFAQSAPPNQVSSRARQLHERAIVVDTHDKTFFDALDVTRAPDSLILNGASAKARTV